MADPGTAVTPRVDGDSAGPAVPGGPADPGSRGRLEIADRAVDRLARAAALRVAGVAPPAVGGPGSSGVGDAVTAALTRPYPRVGSQVAGGRCRVEVQLAVLWPHPAATVAAAVRDRVADELGRLLDLQVDAVDVAVEAFERPQRSVGRRVR